MLRPNLSPALFACVLMPLLFTACGKNEVIVYRTAKTEPAAAGPAAPAPAGAAPATMSGTAVATAAGAELSWTAAPGWQPKPGNAMRKGSYLVPDATGSSAELAITAFPGDVGGEIANVNRWRGQLQLGPLADAEVSAGVTRLAVNGLAVAVVDFANPASAPPQRIIGAMVPFGGATWFFKLTGADATVASAKPAFLAFLQTVKPSQPATAAPTP
ncbi:MAG TPA: hypothetical protein VHO24_18960 [Opitutaceae bacterium]|nr:hypothetical protein [Opitutaceae bacterium]